MPFSVQIPRLNVFSVKKRLAILLLSKFQLIIVNQTCFRSNWQFLPATSLLSKIYKRKLLLSNIESPLMLFRSKIDSQFFFSVKILQFIAILCPSATVDCFFCQNSTGNCSFSGKFKLILSLFFFLFNTTSGFFPVN